MIKTDLPRWQPGWWIVYSLICLFLFLPLLSTAQDIIYKNDGGEIKAKVKEITEETIKYKRYDHLEGPLRNISKREVFMIIYENGKREKFVSKKTTENQDEDQSSSRQTQEQTESSASKFDRDSGTFIDQRDGQKYKWVRIGDQVWMAENLNYDTQKKSWCYNENPQYCKKYGKLYAYNTAKKACPGGWSLPTTEDWEQMFQYIAKNQEIRYRTPCINLDDDGSACVEREIMNIARYLKSPKHWKNNNLEKPRDPYGFSLKPAGYHNFNGIFYTGYDGIEKTTHFWAIYESDIFGLNTSESMIYNFFSVNHHIVKERYNKTFSGYSVRCIKD